LEFHSTQNIPSVANAVLPNDEQTVLKTCKGKGKAIPSQALTGLEGSRRLRLPDFNTFTAKNDHSRFNN
jgi:hypothetical protein